MNLRNSTSAFIAFASALLLSTGAYADPMPVSSGSSPNVFVENKGQVTDQDKKPRADIQFRMPAANGLSIFVGNGAVHYQFSKQIQEAAAPPAKGAAETNRPEPARTRVELYRFDVELIGANKAAKAVVELPQEYSERYFFANSGNEGTTAHSYDKVTYKNVYPNIDWVLYSKKGKMKHEFVVHKGGKISDIRLKYSGTTGLTTGIGGTLEAKCPMGAITEAAPYTYQVADKKPIATKYKLSGDTLSYSASSYEGEIVIDPDLTWMTFYGGSSDDDGRSIVVDPTGNVFVAGSTNSSSNIATSGTYMASMTSAVAAFIVKMSGKGVRQWATYYNGDYYDQGQAIALDNAGNIFLTGLTYSSSGIATPGAHRETYNYNDGFLVKFNSAGARLWATYFGGYGYANVMATDIGGNVYIAGNTSQGTGYTTAGAHQEALAGENDVFLTKFDGAGVQQWGTYFGGAGYDEVRALKIDGSGNLYMAGITSSTTDIATPGAYQTTLLGTRDGFLAKFTAAGVRSWATYYGGENDDIGLAAAIDASGNVFLGGATTSLTGIASIGAYQLNLFPAGPQDVYLAKFNSSGTRQWGTYYGRAGFETVRDLNVDGSGDLWVTGFTNSDTGLATTGAIYSTLAGGNDILLSRFSTAGAKTYATYLGGTADDNLLDAALDANGNLYITGNTYSSVLSTLGAHQTTIAGGMDAFIGRINIGVGFISGPITVCDAVTLTNTPAGGTWSSNNSSVAVIGSASGVLTAVGKGMAVVTYTLPSGIFATQYLYAGLDGISTISGNGVPGETGDGGTASAATLISPQAVRANAIGDLYVMTGNKVRKINTSGTISTIAGSSTGGDGGAGGPATSALLNSPRDMAIDAAGNIYIADTWNNKIKKINTSGIITTIGGGGSSTSEGVPATTASLSSPFCLAIDDLGNVYFLEDWSYRVRKIDASGIISTYAGNTTGIFSGDGGPAITAGIASPSGLAVTAAGDLLIRENGRIRKVSGGTITTIAGGSSIGDAGNGGPATSAVLGYGGRIAVDNAGNIILADYLTVRMIDTAGIIDLFAGNGSYGFTGDGEPAIYAATGDGIVGIGTDASGNVYMTDVNTHRIRKVTRCQPTVSRIAGHHNLCVGAHAVLSSTPAGGTWSSSNTSKVTVTASGYITGVAAGSAMISYTTSPGVSAVTNLFVGQSGLETVAGISKSAGNTGDGGQALAARLKTPTTVATDTNGNIYVTSEHVIRKIDAMGVISTIAGIDGSGYHSGDGGLATAATLNAPSGIAVSGTGDIYIADRLNNRIRKISGGVITTILGDGTYSSSGDGGPAILGTCAYPSGIALDAAGNIYFTDQGAGKVRMINTSGNVVHIAGNGTYGFSGDGGAAITAQLNQPFGIALDAADNIYVSDRANHRVRKINTSGIISTVAGSDMVGLEGDGGPATAAALKYPLGITSDGHGNIFFTEEGNCTIRKISSTGVISRVAGNGIPTWPLDGGAAAETPIEYAWGIAADTSGKIYFTQYNDATVKVITSCGNHNELPPITGTLGICEAGTTTLHHETAGGTWSSSNTAVGTIGSATGILSGLGVGTTTISYVCSLGTATAVVTVSEIPGPITGAPGACIGGTSVLSVTPTGGMWSSSSSHAIIGSVSGVITGVSAGTAGITYTRNGCSISTVASISALPAAITGTAVMCGGATVTLNSTTAGGSWTTSTSSVATVGTSGVVTGAAAGTATISYTTGGACSRTRVVTVNAAPDPITGTLSVCSGSSTTLSSAPAGGTWSGGVAGIATVGATSGTVTGGASGGTAIITYTRPVNACKAYATVTVSVIPAAITGTLSVCAGRTTTLNSTTAGGTWSTVNTAVGTVGTATTGIITGVSAGTTVVSYITGGTCGRAATVTVHATPAPVTGTYSVCAGSNTTLATTSTGGAWISSSTAVASVVSSTGVVTGNTAGTSTVSYYISSTGCFSSAVFSVNALPAAITGASSVCEGASTTFASTTTGGEWTSATSHTAVGSSSGAVDGITAGSSRITYMLASGCYVSKPITVNLTPAPITGVMEFCEAGTTTLFNSTAGGGWISGTPATASIGASTGLVTGLAGGTSIISYSMTTGCRATAIVTVNVLPAAIAGTLTTCAGATTTLTNTSPGGTWASGSSSVATIGSLTGIASGVAMGTASITYILGTGCARSATLTVNPLPAAISGPATVCHMASVNATSATSGGVWTSSTPAIATVEGGTGKVTGISPGTTTVSYMLSATGCYVTREMTVNALPAPITGSMLTCAGTATPLASATGGGVWTSSTTTVATVGATTGIVTGMGYGTAIITYTLPSTCTDTAVVQVDTMLVYSVAGDSHVCIGTPITLTATMPGGTWSSSNTSRATVSSAGVVTGIASGSVTISYSFTNGCGPISKLHALAVYTPEQCDSVAGVTNTDVQMSWPVELFPNPNTGSFSLLVHSYATAPFRYSIINQLGQVVHEGEGRSNNTIQMNIELMPGAYTLMISNEQRRQYQKFVCIRP